MGTLTVRRGNDHLGRSRKLNVYVDDQKLVGLLPNCEATIEISPGPCVITGRMDWCRSPGLTLDGDHLPAVVLVSFPFKATLKWSFTRVRP